MKAHALILASAGKPTQPPRQATSPAVSDATAGARSWFQARRVSGSAPASDPLPLKPRSQPPGGAKPPSPHRSPASRPAAARTCGGGNERLPLKAARFKWAPPRPRNLCSRGGGGGGGEQKVHPRPFAPCVQTEAQPALPACVGGPAGLGFASGEEPPTPAPDSTCHQARLSPQAGSAS